MTECTEFQAGDLIKKTCGAIARVLTKSSQNLTWVAETGREPEEIADDQLTMHKRWEDQRYPMPLTDWKKLDATERQAIIALVIEEHGDFREEFYAYMDQRPNQALFNEFVALSIERRKTHRHYSSKAVFEHLRWNQHQVQDAGTQFKINNNYTADLARLSMRLFPELEEFFNTRIRARKAA